MKASFENIIDQLKRNEFHPVYFLMGEEPLYIDKISQYIENEIIDEANRDFNQVVFYAKDTTPEEVVASAKEFPFGVDRRVVLVKEAQNWKEIDPIIKYAENPQPSTILAICHKYGRVDTKKIKPFDTNGIIFESQGVKTWNLGSWVEKCAQEHHFSIDQKATNLLAEHIGNDLSRIDNEFSKLQIILPENSRITPDIIEKHIGINKQYNLYELQDALTSHDEVRAYQIILAFCSNLKNNPLVRTIDNLFYFYKSLLNYHLSAEKDLENLKLIFGANKSPQMLYRQAKIAATYSMVSLIKIIHTLQEFDARSKGINNSLSEEELYKELIYRILH